MRIGIHEYIYVYIYEYAGLSGIGSDWYQKEKNIDAGTGMILD